MREGFGRLIIALFFVTIFFSNNVAEAETAKCTAIGYTVVFVNGILNDENKARASQKSLERALPQDFDNEAITVRLGHNPSHFSGAGDVIHSIFQAFDAGISEYDLKTILMQIYPEATTRKILLVGHSQGTFYTNEMYKYLISHGVPRESIAVYNIATPASYVAGGGLYVTSSNDKIIGSIRDTEIEGNKQIHLNSYYTAGSVVSSALRANITIAKEQGWEENKFGGHGFSVYMDGAGEQIVGEISKQLELLRASGASEGGCFIPPEETLAYKAQSLLFKVGDTQAGNVASVTSSVKNSALALADDAYKLFASAIAGFGVGSASPRNQGAAAALVFAPEVQANNPTPQTQGSPTPTPATPVTVKLPQEAAPETVGETDAPIETPTPAPASPTPPQLQPTIPPWSYSPGYGGGGGSSNQSSSNTTQSAPAVVVAKFTVDSPENNAQFATTSTTFTGTADPETTVTSLYGSDAATTTADAAGNWSLTLNFIEGPAQIDFSAADLAGHSSPTVSRSVVIDLTAPTPPIPSIAACGLSLSPDFCLVPVASVQVSWDALSDASAYSVLVNGIPGAQTTATAASAALDASATTTIEVVAYDAAGNAATSTSLSIRSVAQPLIINEIAWGGTDADQSDQWIEVKSISPFKIDLSKFSISRSGSSSPISLFGTLPTDINTYFSVVHKATVPFDPLSTAAAEQLTLMWNGEVIDQTPTVSTCASWCAGAYMATIGTSASGSSLQSPLSMERKSGTDGALASSWQSTDSYGPYLGNNNTTISGTMGVENSTGYPDSGVFCKSPNQGTLADLVQVHGNFNPGTGNGYCTYLSRSIAGTNAPRYGGLFRGEVGSSTAAVPFLGKGLAKEGATTLPADAQAGEHFFFAIFEARVGDVFNDPANFYGYFSSNVPATPPHGNYVYIPFVYQP